MIDAVYRAEPRRVLAGFVQAGNPVSPDAHGRYRELTAAESAVASSNGDGGAPRSDTRAVERILGRRLCRPQLVGHGFQNPCDGMRNARLKREDAFSHAMIIVSSAMVSSS